MSSKQKIALSAIGIVLVLAIVGLTIGLVLVANSATTTNTMTLTYNATNVDCKITASANNGITIGSEASKYIEVDAKATTTEAGAFAFDPHTFSDANVVYTYTFEIENTAAAGAAAIKAELTQKATTKITNMKVNMATKMVDAEGEEVTSIAVGESAFLTITVEVDDATIAASFVGDYTLTVTQA